MTKSFMTRLRNERGIAMTTVLFVGAALTAITSVASLSVIKEFGAGSDDRKAADALAYAEAGIDRSIQYIRGQNWGVLKTAGCEKPALSETSTPPLPSGTVGNGTFTATMRVFNPSGTTTATRYADGNPLGAACAARPATAKDPLFVVIKSIGEHPKAKRTVEQVVKIQSKGLPIGLFARSIDVGGTPNVYNVSMVSETQITGREKLVFQGCDPYYTLEQFYPDAPGLTTTQCGAFIPSAAHAVSGIALKQNGSNPEFGGNPLNCTANSNPGASGDARYQSIWDGDGTATSGAFSGTCTAWGNGPGTSKFTEADKVRVSPQPELTPQDYEMIKQRAKEVGIYCSIGATTTCTRMGQSISAASVWNDTDIAPLYAAGTNNILAYFEFTTGTATTNEIKWKAAAWPCNSVDPALTKSAVIVVRNGGMSVQNGAQINGALIMDGDFKYNGSVEFLGSIISKSIINASGGMTFSLNSCWVENMPWLFTNATPTQWSEIDR
ncbi:MAG: hypothetical protein ACRDJ2_12035 [Actinomycetota bacterium]